MVYKKGSKGEVVKKIQSVVGVKADGVFGNGTENTVKKWQKEHGLVADGIVGEKTLKAMGITEEEPQTQPQHEQTSLNTTPSDKLILHQYYLKKGEYYENKGQNNKYIFLHHTAGADNPYRVVDAWANDKQGCVATEFVIGGKPLSGKAKYDGEVVQCFPNRNCWSYHLGITSPSGISRRSVGIELCNYGYLTEDGKTYTKKKVSDEDIVTLEEPFRGHKKYHRYTDEQLKSLYILIKHIANRDNIDVHEGLYKWIKEKGKKAFDYSADAFNGKILGVLTHANVRKDKSDCFPQPELMDMILSL